MPTKKTTILTADDDPQLLRLITRNLQLEGYEVLPVSDGQQALEQIEQKSPDVVLLDVMMPRMDGYELARRVRANSSTRFIPIIIQTAARGSDRDARRGAEVGALGYITDPTDLDLLRARARTLIDFKDYLNTCEEQAFTDHLTGLANRRRFERQLEREMARSLRYEHPFCLLLLDLDNFKQVNDRFGHQLGDEALSMLAKTLQAETRGIDLAARIGGEEFAVLLTETGYEGGVEVAERLRESIKQVSVPGVGHVTASFGVAEFPTCAGSASDLIECADAALYEAKRQGRDRVARAAALTANQG